MNVTLYIYNYTHPSIYEHNLYENCSQGENL
jgi:hypothetical protein